MYHGFVYIQVWKYRCIYVLFIWCYIFVYCNLCTCIYPHGGMCACLFVVCMFVCAFSHYIMKFQFELDVIFIYFNSFFIRLKKSLWLGDLDIYKSIYFDTDRGIFFVFFCLIFRIKWVYFFKYNLFLVNKDFQFIGIFFFPSQEGKFYNFFITLFSAFIVNYYNHVLLLCFCLPTLFCK